MSKYAIRLLTLGICATALVVVPIAKPANAETSRSKHVYKHKKIYRSPGFTDPWAAGQVQPVARPPSRAGCPGIARSFECGTWPPPFEDDPDRKVSGTDGG
jgi:hypothetical protein